MDKQYNQKIQSKNQANSKYKKATSVQDGDQISTFSFLSADEILKKYKQFYRGKEKEEEFFTLIFTELKKSLIEDDIDSIKKLNDLINSIDELESKKTFHDYYESVNNPLSCTNLVILACKQNRIKILEFLFSKESKILNILHKHNRSVAAVLPKDKDESHNAFYYAVHSSNIELLHILIDQWPGNHFNAHSEELDELLSTAYEGCKLNNVLLTDEIEIFLLNKLFNLRFFSCNLRQNPSYHTNDINYIHQRIDLVNENINVLYSQYSKKEVDEKFLLISKFIVKNIHVLKSFLTKYSILNCKMNSTYDKLPWEEIEFCLISFICSYIKKHEMNLYYLATLTKDKILNYLNNFAVALQEKKYLFSQNIDQSENRFTKIHTVEKEKFLAAITRQYPQFNDLYEDYATIKDAYSLEKICDCVNLSSSVDPRQRDGQLVILRTLQVIGEHLKNTLQSPNLSNRTAEILLLSLPKSTRKILVRIRNSLSHSYSISKEIEVDENGDWKFFIGIQDDVKKVGNAAIDILKSKKNKIIRIISERILQSQSVDGLTEIGRTLPNVKWDKLTPEQFKTIGHEKIKENIKRLSDVIKVKTENEKMLFDEIDGLINATPKKIENLKFDFIIAFETLKMITNYFNDKKVDKDVIEELSFCAKKILKNIDPEIKPCNLKKIAKLSVEIFQSASLRIAGESVDEMYRLFSEIIFIAEIDTSNIIWIQELSEKLIPTHSEFHTRQQQVKNSITSREKCESELLKKISELKSILQNNGIDCMLPEKISDCKNNKKFLAIIEMCALDVMSDLSKLKNFLENNSLFLDDNVPLLSGKCFRNYLAHQDALLGPEVGVCDPLISVILNVLKLTSENLIKSKKKIGKFIRDEPFKLRDKLSQELNIITNKYKMFAMLEEGNMVGLKDLLNRGADIKARDINSLTALHFAAKGPNLEVVKFIKNEKVQFNIKDINGQTPLHVAAAHGREIIIQYFLKEENKCINHCDNSGRTPLHFAAQNGHKQSVEILLKYKADSAIHDSANFTPLHYAIKNNCIDVVKILIKPIKSRATFSDNKLLHIAAEHGHPELVNFLIANGASIHARNDQEGIPLQIATINGHLDIVTTMISKGVDINSTAVNGATALHYAAEHGHEDIADVLIKHGANVDSLDITSNFTPLHYAASNGHAEIVTNLLKKNANADISSIDGETPLHFAIKGGYLKIVTILLKYGVKVNTKDKKNNGTPLHYAAENGHSEIVELLIKYGSNINARANNDFTPLHLAVLKDHKNVSEVLIKYNANINARDNNGSTLLHLCAMNGNKDVCILLMKNNADVNVKGYNGMTPLLAATMNGRRDIVQLLIENKANVNSRNNNDITPLHAAAMKGYEDIVNILLKRNAEIEAKCSSGATPLQLAIMGGHIDVIKLFLNNKGHVNYGGSLSELLHLAVESGQKETIKILLAKGAEINTKNEKNLTPLMYAVKHNFKEIVEYLVLNGADVSAEVEGIDILTMAVMAGYRDIVKILLRNKKHCALVNTRGPKNLTPLHLAASRGFKDIVKVLTLNGADVNAKSIDRSTPLFFAAEGGHDGTVDFLIMNGANVDARRDDGATALHIVAVKGHTNVLKVLLKYKAVVYIKDEENRTALELAVSYGHLEIVQELLKFKMLNINDTGNDGWTILHIASQGTNLEMVKYLVREGSDMNARNSSGSKAIHIAAREGNKGMVEFFLSKGLSIEELGQNNQTLLHYAAMKGRLEVAEYLIERGANVDVANTQGFTPIHFAANFGCEDVIKILLKNGACYNPISNIYSSPLHMANNKVVVDHFKSVEKLFEAVKINNISQVKNLIDSKNFIVNAKNCNHGTSLHYAAWKGYHEIVDILLQKNANPNSKCKAGVTPLHYAAKFSHLRIVKTLLCWGAIYNAATEKGKTLMDFAGDKHVTDLFEIVNESFKLVRNGNIKVISYLNKVKEIDTIRAIMSAKSSDNETLITMAIRNNFSKVDELKEIKQEDVSTVINKGLMLLKEGNYKSAFSNFKIAFERRKTILGPDNPATLDLQILVASALSEQGQYTEALNMYETVYEKWINIFGVNNKNSLSIRSAVALVLHRLEENEKALGIFKEVYEKQKEMLEPKDPEILQTQFHMALVLDRVGKYEEALDINRMVLKVRRETLGSNDPCIFSAENNIAMVLANQGKLEEAMSMYKEVYRKKVQVFGKNHAQSVRTLHNIAGLFSKQHKYYESVKAHQEVLDIRKNVLGHNHPDTLITQYNLANVLILQGSAFTAYETFMDIYDKCKVVFGLNHAIVLDISEKLQIINKTKSFEGSHLPQNLCEKKNEFFIAASTGDENCVEHLLKHGFDTNVKDINGRTPLHFAVSNGHTNIVQILLEKGADVTQITIKGNTPLHIAASKSYHEIMKILLHNVSKDKFNDFMNAKTFSSGNTAIHVAAKNDSLEVVKFLLSSGAIYNSKNKEGRIPMDLSCEQKVNKLLKLVKESFEDAKSGNQDVINKLRKLKTDDFIAVANCRNDQANTLLQVAIINKHNDIASTFLTMLKQQPMKY